MTPACLFFAADDISWNLYSVKFIGDNQGIMLGNEDVFLYFVGSDLLVSNKSHLPVVVHESKRAPALPRHGYQHYNNSDARILPMCFYGVTGFMATDPLHNIITLMAYGVVTS